MKRIVTAVVLAAATMASAPAMSQSTRLADVVTNYADIALAGFRDSIYAAEELKAATETLLREPGEDNLIAAQRAWQLARIAYQQTEVFRFTSPLVEEWVGRVNAWPIDEGFIDYVDEDYLSVESDNPFYTADLIGSEQITIDGEVIPLETFTPELLQRLDGAGGVETNVARGYHAIEYLLWGPDTEKTDDLSGSREFTDFVTGDECTNGDCDRRAQFLFAAIDLLINDLREMVGNWEITGDARSALTDDPAAGLSAILHGMRELSSQEIAGTYLQRGLDLADADWEMDDFSDYTHVTYLLSARGVVNVFLGEYYSIEGETITGASLADLVRDADPALDEELRVSISMTMARLRMLLRRVRDVETFDQMILAGNEEGNALVTDIIEALEDQTEVLGRVGEAIGLPPYEVSVADNGAMTSEEPAA